MRPHSDEAPAPTIQARYLCGNGHYSVVTYSAQAENFPRVVSCKKCFTNAVWETEAPVEILAGQPVEIATPMPPDIERHSIIPGTWFTPHHRDELFTRRTPQELEELLAERLEVARGRRTER